MSFANFMGSDPGYPIKSDSKKDAKAMTISPKFAIGQKVFYVNTDPLLYGVQVMPLTITGYVVTDDGVTHCRVKEDLMRNFEEKRFVASLDQLGPLVRVVLEAHKD